MKENDYVTRKHCHKCYKGLTGEILIVKTDTVFVMWELGKATWVKKTSLTVIEKPNDRF